MDAKEFVARMNAIEQETDKARRRRLASELNESLEQDMARATVDLVESIRSHSGDRAAEKALEILREGRKRI